MLSLTYVNTFLTIHIRIVVNQCFVLFLTFVSFSFKEKLKMESKKLITKENFEFLDVPNLLVNVFGYGEIVSLKLHKKWCIELLEEKWNNEEWLPLDLVLKNLKNEDFFMFDKVSSAELEMYIKY